MAVIKMCKITALLPSRLQHVCEDNSLSRLLAVQYFLQHRNGSVHTQIHVLCLDVTARAVSLTPPSLRVQTRYLR